MSLKCTAALIALITLAGGAWAQQPAEAPAPVATAEPAPAPMAGPEAPAEPLPPYAPPITFFPAEIAVVMRFDFQAIDATPELKRFVDTADAITQDFRKELIFASYTAKDGTFQEFLSRWPSNVWVYERAGGVAPDGSEAVVDFDVVHGDWDVMEAVAILESLGWKDIAHQHGVRLLANPERTIFVTFPRPETLFITSNESALRRMIDVIRGIVDSARRSSNELATATLAWGEAPFFTSYDMTGELKEDFVALMMGLNPDMQPAAAAKAESDLRNMVRDLNGAALILDRDTSGLFLRLGLNFASPDAAGKHVAGYTSILHVIATGILADTDRDPRIVAFAERVQKTEFEAAGTLLSVKIPITEDLLIAVLMAKARAEGMVP